MPREWLQYEVTPIGMHYLLIHFDIPHVEEAKWRLQIDGRVTETLALSLDEIRSCPRVTARVTIECAGNGRATMTPRPKSQPWLDEAAGTGEWTGTPLGPVPQAAGMVVWSFPWDATEGRHELLSRATDNSGNIQPFEPIWNVKGVANNACQRVIVHVRPDVTV